MLIFGYAATLEIHHIPTAVLDYDNSQVSRDLLSRFTASPYFDVRAYLNDRQQIRDLIDRGEVTIALQINAGFAQDLRKGERRGLRDGAHLGAVLPFTAERFARALVMPNLKPPMTTTAALAQYRARILQALPAGSTFEPFMTLYLTDRTPPAEVHAARASGFVVGAKLYPAGATTHSDAGVTSIDNVWGTLEAMADAGLVLQVPGEVTSPEVDVFDREHEFIDRVLAPVVERVPGLKVEDRKGLPAPPRAPSRAHKSPPKPGAPAR